MANQALKSLNSQSLQNVIEQENKRTKIAQLRRLHQGIIGCKVWDKNTSFNGIQVNGPQVDSGAAKKKKVTEVEAVPEDSSDDEVINAIT